MEAGSRKRVAVSLWIILGLVLEGTRNGGLSSWATLRRLPCQRTCQRTPSRLMVKNRMSTPQAGVEEGRPPAPVPRKKGVTH